MKSKIIFALTILIASISISNAKYYVLNDSNAVLGQCNKLTIEKDSNGGFARAIFSDCLNSMVFSYSRDFHYRETGS